MRFRKLEAEYDPTDRNAAYATVKRLQEGGEVVTGLYVEKDAADMHARNQTAQAPLYDYHPCEQLCPGSAALDELMRELE